MVAQANFVGLEKDWLIVMSGICAIVNFDNVPVDPAVLQRMTNQVAYRGLDGIYYRIHENIGFANLALHTTFESEYEFQPLVDKSSGVWLTADARLSNRNELCHILKQKTQLHSERNTDAEIILASYLCWGFQCPDYLIGDFAFVIWDDRKQSLFCARDVFGVKPLHYARVGGNIYVASEAQQIIQNPSVPYALDDIGVAVNLLNIMHDHESTLFSGIKALTPGHCFVATADKWSLHRYWNPSLSDKIRYKQPEEYAEHFKELFFRSVAENLRSNRNLIGVDASGGVDCSSILAVAQRHVRDRYSSIRLTPVSQTYPTLPDCDERLYTDELSHQLELPIYYFPMTPPQTFGNQEMDTDFEFPLLVEDSALQSLLFMRDQGIRIHLCGIGAEPLMQGSSLIYFDSALKGEIELLKHLFLCAKAPYYQVIYAYLLRPLISSLFSDKKRMITNHHFQDWIADDFLKKTLPGLQAPQLSQHFPLTSISLRDIYTSIVIRGAPSRLIHRLSCINAHFGLELRYPFLDRNLAEFILSIPLSQVSLGGASKLLLRKAMRGVLPELLRTRVDKTVYSSYNNLLLWEYRQQIEELGTRPLSSQLGFIKGDRLWERLQKWYSIDKSQQQPYFNVWLILSLELWLRKFYQPSRN